MNDRNNHKKRIAVISSNRDISSFFELEAMACGCSVRVFSSPPQELLEFDFVVLDLAAGYCFLENSSCQSAAVCAKGKKAELNCFDYVWEWPVSVQTVREAYEDTICVKVPVTTEFAQNNTIYFLTEPTNTVVYRNQTIALTQSEWRILQLISKSPEQSVSREEISALFEDVKGNLPQVHICHLRKKLEEPFGIRLIETVRGKGYSLKAKVIYL